MFEKINEPRKKNFRQKEFLIPVPIPCKHPNKNIGLISYAAFIEDKHVMVKDEWHAKALYKCGFFGKGEYSKGVSNLDQVFHKRIDESDSQNEYSIDSRNISNTITNERYRNRLNWSNIKKNKLNNSDDISLKFLNEFVCFKLSEIDNSNQIKYSKVDYEDVIPLEDVYTIENIYKSSNNPFFYKIRKMLNIKLNEYLCLMYEEAFYLKFAFDCLDILLENSNNILNTNECWNLFQKYDSRFPFKYAVYHKFRNKGWILKNGIKYGCEFMAYYMGPDYYHASFGIKVETLKINEYDCLINENNDEFSKLSALIRINETVSKQVVICYVIDTNLNNDYRTVECLKYFAINELLINRWVPGSDLSKMKISSSNKAELSIND